MSTEGPTFRLPATWLRASAAAAALLLAAACSSDSPDKLMSSAKEYLAKGDRNAAVIQLKNVLQKDPKHAEARLLLGRTLLQQGDALAAEKELRRALEFGRTADEVLPSLAPAMVAAGSHAELIREFGSAKLADPGAEAAFRTALGDAHLRTGRTDAAAEAYLAALSARPGDARAQLGMAYVAAATGSPQDALKLVDAALAADPGLSRAYVLKSQLLASAGDREGAKAVLATTLKSDPADVEPRAALVSMLLEERAFDRAGAQLDEARKAGRGSDLRMVFLDAELAFRRGDRKLAREKVQQVLKAAPTHVPSLILQAGLDLADNNVASAQAGLQKAIAEAPRHDGARRLLAATYLRAGQPTRALEALQPVLKSAGERVDSSLALLAGEAYLAKGDVKQASEYFAAAQSGDRQKVAAATRLGQIALATGRTEEGLQQLEAAAGLSDEQYQADLALITAHLRKNEFDRALAAARALEKKQPNNPLSHQMLGLVTLARKDMEAARRHFARAVELQPTYLPAVSALANLDLAQNRPEDARRRFDEVIAKDPTIEQAYLTRAEIEARTGAPTEAIAALLERAVKAAPPAVNARVALVGLHLRRGDANSALSVAQAAASAVPEDPRVLEALAQAQDAAGQYNQAVETLQKIVAQQPKAPQPLLRLAGLHAKNKQFDRAVDAQRRAQRLVPDDGRVAVALAGYLVAAGRADEALKEARAFQARLPKRPEGFAIEGDIHANQQRWPEAERAYREALKLEPRAGALAARVHSAMASAGKVAEAEAFGRRWAADHPKDVAIRMHLADRALRDRNLKTAFGHYNEVIALDPNNALALNNLAWVAGELGDARAIGFAERAAQLAPNNAAVLDTLGMLLVNRGEIGRGMEALERARRLAPEQPQLRMNYARALMKAGRREAARTELEALQKLPQEFPGKTEIPALLKSI